MRDVPSRRFAFGRNWQSFVDRRLDEERVRIAQDHLLGFLGIEDLAGKRMIDIGSGSGIHSLAAIRAGVTELLSFDYDPDSVAATRRLHALAGAPAHWRVEQGSALDVPWLAALGRFDLVYSWGVLHHTGDVWAAFRNAAELMAPHGHFYVALYTPEVFTFPSAEFWLKVKRAYSRGGWPLRRMIEGAYVAANIARMLARGRNPIAQIRGYKRSRGMSYMTDVRDWVGGWPMEFVTRQQVEDFAAGLGLQLMNIKTGEANIEYLFQIFE